MKGKIIINDKKYEFREKETIYQVARRNGIFIPTYCYHSQLRVVASCRICLVEVELGNKRFVAPACSTFAQDGMIVYTDSEQVRKERYAIMQFLLLNHPPECPVCDEGGKCLLQDFTQEYGPSFSLFKYERDCKKYDVGPLIRFYPELCILCERCYRFWKEELNEDEIISKERGNRTYIGPAEDIPLLKGFSGYLIELCPVGAFLDNTTSKFSSRPWDLEEIDTSCPFCSLFCGIRAYPRKRVRTRPYQSGRKISPDRIYDIRCQNKGIIDTLICDRGKFGKDFLISEKILSNAKINGEWREINKKDITLKLKTLIENYTPQSIGVVCSARLGNEEIDLLKEVFVEERGIKSFLLVPGIIDTSANFMISDFELGDVEKDTFILHTGYDFFNSHPVLGLEILRRLRKFPGEILPAYFRIHPFKEKVPFLFSISYQEGKVKREASESFVTDFRNSFKLLLAILSELSKIYGVKKEMENVFSNYFLFLKRIENIDTDKILREIKFGKERFRRILNKIKKSKKMIVIYQDFIPYKIQKLLFTFKYLDFPVKVLILRFSPNTEYFLEKKFPLINFKEFYYRLKKGLLKLIIFIYTNPFLEIYPYSKVKEIFERCETVVLDTFSGLHADISEFVVPLKSVFEREMIVKDNFGKNKSLKKVVESERLNLKEILLSIKKGGAERLAFSNKIEIDLNDEFEDIYFLPSLYNFGYEPLFSSSLKRVEKPPYLFFPFENEEKAIEFEKINKKGGL